MNDITRFQFEELKKGNLFVHQIKNWTDEMKWWLIENDKSIPLDCELTKDMVIDLVKRGSDRLRKEHIESYNICEKDWIEGINNYKGVNMFFADNFLYFVLKNVTLTNDIALALCIKYPLFWTDKKIKELILEEDKLKISNSFFDGLKNDVDLHFQLPSDLPISKEQWEWIVEKGYLLHCTGRIETYIANRNDTPEFVRYDTLKNHMYLKEWGPISKDDLIFWLKTYKDETDDWYFTESVKYYIKCDDMESVMKECGWFIKYWKNQSAKLCKAAVECDPHNIQYIKKPTDKLALYALSLDKTVEKYLKKTKAICEFLEIKYEKPNPYPSKYYLVKFNEDLCDEGYLIKVCVVKGKDMEKFLNKTTSLSFGNLYDNEEREVKDIASYQPITEEELSIIKKFGLDDLESGYFSDLD